MKTRCLLVVACCLVFACAAVLIPIPLPAGAPANIRTGEALHEVKGDAPRLDITTTVQQPNLSQIVTSRIGGIEEPIYPSNPNPDAGFAIAGPWSFPTPIRVVKQDAAKGDDAFYDPKSNSVTVYLETPYDTAMSEDLYRAKKALAREYRRREPGNQGIDENLVSLQRIPLTGYEISLEIKGKEIPIRTKKPSDSTATTAFVGKRAFSSPIEDKATQALLLAAAATPGSVVVKVRAYYQMRKVVVTKVSARMVDSALVRVSESVKGALKEGFISVGTVARDGRAEAKALVRNEIQFEISRTDNTDADVVDSLRSLVSDSLDKYFAGVKPMTLQDAANTGEQFVIWTNGTGRLELAPEQYSKLTSSLDTGESFEQTWEKAFDYLNTTIKESDNYEKFYRKLRNDLSTGSSANGSFLGILSGGMSFTLHNEFESLSEDEKRQIEKFYDSYHKTGLDKGTMKNASYRRFTGEDYLKGARPKPLELFHVSKNDLARLVVVTAVDTRVVGSANTYSDFEFTLAGASDAYGEIRLGMMIPYFGNELPEGYVWADGKSNWPDEPSWVPKHIRNSPVPNMDGWLIGGTNDQVLVGTEFKSGKIEIAKQSVPGSKFSLPDPKKLRVSPGVGTAKEGGWVGAFNRNANYPPEKGGPLYLAAGDAFGGKMAAEPAEYTGYDTKPDIGGNVDLTWSPITLNETNTLPRHYRARWIIRVR